MACQKNSHNNFTLSTVIVIVKSEAINDTIRRTPNLVVVGEGGIAVRYGTE